MSVADGEVDGEEDGEEGVAVEPEAEPEADPEADPEAGGVVALEDGEDDGALEDFLAASSPQAASARAAAAAISRDLVIAGSFEGLGAAIIERQK